MNIEHLKLNILQFFGDIYMNEEEHKYYLNNKPLKISVSGVIKNFYKPFDSYNISKNSAKKHGVTQESLLKEWDNNKDAACEKGNKAHKFGEVYPFNRHLKPKTKQDEAIVKFWNELPDYIVPVMAECMMYHKKYLFPGTMDILLYNLITGEYIIADYKTNKDLFKNYNNQKMLGVFSNMLETPFSKYVIQLSLYQILLQQISGIKISSRKIIWLKDDGDYVLYDAEDLTETLNKELETINFEIAC